MGWKDFRRDFPIYSLRVAAGGLLLAGVLMFVVGIMIVRGLATLGLIGGVMAVVVSAALGYAVYSLVTSDRWKDRKAENAALKAKQIEEVQWAQVEGVVDPAETRITTTPLKLAPAVTIPGRAFLTDASITISVDLIWDRDKGFAETNPARRVPLVKIRDLDLASELWWGHRLLSLYVDEPQAPDGVAVENAYLLPGAISEEFCTALTAAIRRARFEQ